MSEAKFEVKFTASAEVRDAEGNLLSSTPVEFVHEMSEENLRELGLTDEHFTEIKEQKP